MIAYVTMGMAVVPMVSPLIGGILDEQFGWQSNFWAFLIVGAVIFALVWTDLGETSVASGLTLGQQFREYPELLSSRRFWGYSMASGFCSGAFFAYLGGGRSSVPSCSDCHRNGSAFYSEHPQSATSLAIGSLGETRNAWASTSLFCGAPLQSAADVSSCFCCFWQALAHRLSFFGLMTCVGLGNGLGNPERHGWHVVRETASGRHCIGFGRRDHDRRRRRIGLSGGVSAQS